MKQQQKKKGSNAFKQGGINHASISKDNEELERAVNNLIATFGSVSVDEATFAYKEANGDLNKAAEILCDLVESNDDQSTTCSSSSGNLGSSSGSSNSEVFAEDHSLRNGARFKGKSKKVVAVAGTVSTVLAKDYVRSTPGKSSSKFKGLNDKGLSKEEDALQFLSSMLGMGSELDLPVVRDVLCQCGYDVEKALNVLLELSASSSEQPKIRDCILNTKVEAVLLDSSESFTDRTSDSTSHSSEGEFQDNVWFWGHPGRNQFNVAGCLANSSSSRSGNTGSELPQKVLESLFSLPTPKSAEHEPTTMNWKNVVKKMTSLGHNFESSPDNIPSEQHIRAEGDEYLVFREAARQHWDLMKSHYQKAATAFGNGQREYAAHLSEKGRLQNRKAKEADEKASQDIFAARNKKMGNMITIDLHGQHVKQAMRLLKLHLLFGAYVRSVQTFKVITGCGSHGVGKSKLKTSVIDLLQKEAIDWSEENSGTLLIRLNGRTNFSFVELDDSDDDR